MIADCEHVIHHIVWQKLNLVVCFLSKLGYAHTIVQQPFWYGLNLDELIFEDGALYSVRKSNVLRNYRGLNYGRRDANSSGQLVLGRSSCPVASLKRARP